MQQSHCLLLFIAVHYVTLSYTLADNHYTHEWGVEIDGGQDEADQVATELGYRNHGQIGAIDNHYLFTRQDVPKRSKRGADHHTVNLEKHRMVRWAEQQVARLRVKRDFTDIKRAEQRAYKTIHFDDPMAGEQWYTEDTRKSTNLPKQDLHVLPVYLKGITGKGVVVTVLDDGLEHNHTDLAGNYDPYASYDLNDVDSDPFPRYDPTNENKHGTRCAGEIAMIANNKFCGYGVAYNAKIGGVRMLDGKVTDRLEALALSFNHTYIDIYSASWGPNDDGKTVEGPGKMATLGFQKGIEEGRDGKGVIYVWASGNGGGHKDNCDCDGYTANIYTLSISSASQHRKSPWYAERCASTMATTYSSGAYNDRKIVSTDLHNKCTNMHTGTSASAPLAAGIIALVLEQNPSLTWRDLQHLVAWTSEYAPLKSNQGWKQNAAGYMVNSRFGFGLLNAAGLVDAADPKVWKNAPAKTICTVQTNSSMEGLPKPMTSKQELVLTITTTGCDGQPAEVNYLEHVQLHVNMTYNKRGALSIELTSPKGTKTTLLSERNVDYSDQGFHDWPFMSVHAWGEDPKGDWKIAIMDKGRLGASNRGTVHDVKLVLHGTKEMPDHVRRAKGGVRTYNADYNKVKNDRSTETLKAQKRLKSAISKLRSFLSPDLSEAKAEESYPNLPETENQEQQPEIPAENEAYRTAPSDEDFGETNKVSVDHTKGLKEIPYEFGDLLSDTERNLMDIPSEYDLRNMDPVSDEDRDLARNEEEIVAEAELIRNHGYNEDGIPEDLLSYDKK